MLGAAIYAAQWKWHFWHDAQSSQPAVVNAMNDTLEAEQNEGIANPDNNSLKEVLSANLFGAEGVAKTASVEAVPKTAQPLELHGIVFIPHHPEQSVALIAQAGQMAKDYKKGDKVLPEITPGVTVTEISLDVVFIENQGIREKLELPKPDFSQTGNQQPATSPAVQSDNAQAQDSVEPAENPPPPQGNDPQLMTNTQPPPAEPLDNIQPTPASPVDSPIDNPVDNQ